jgi:DNA-binding SARP family transcriptional activator
MKQLRVRLFGRLTIHYNEQPVNGCDSLKVKELITYLLLNRDQPHSRETLASLLWGDSCNTKQSKKYLRSALWRLHKVVDEYAAADNGLIVVNNGWIELKSIPQLWLDVDVFEKAYHAVLGVPEERLSRTQVLMLQDAASVYAGPLLSSWYQDWCAIERQRLRLMNLVMLEKVSGHHESRKEFEVALLYAERILRCDRAHEGAHQRIMRLLYEMGDRTSALRQYRWCREILHDELDAEPSGETVRLYEDIRSNTVLGLAS